MRKEKFFLFLVVLLGLAAGAQLLRPGYFNMHDDLQMMRQLAMEECFQDGQIPCRWAQHMGYGFGFPLFNYYPPFPYLIGQGIRVLGFSFVSTAKYAFFLSFIFSGLAMYVFAREFWGRLGALLSSAFYVWAPYRAVDVYVRGAMNEAWSFVWFPLILWSSYKLIKEAQFRWIVILALSWFGLLTSHNIMVLIFITVSLAWILLWLIKEKSWFTLPQLVIAGLWAVGLSAFFSLPVLLEKSLVHIETLVSGYTEYVAHFVSIRQLLLSRYWGYGMSVFETADEMSFQIGHLHWALSLAVGGIAATAVMRKRKLNNLLLVTFFFIAAGWFAAFMAHQRSHLIWEAIPPLKFVQFPWRFVTLSTLSFSMVAGAVARRPIVVAVLILGVLLLNKDYFRPGFMGPLSDEEKFSGEAFRLQQQAGITDYLPKAAEKPPESPRSKIAEITQGDGEVLDAKQGTDWARVKVSAKHEAVLRINIFDFPQWRVFLDGEEVEINKEGDELGRIHIKVGEGEHEIYAKLHDTPVRTAANLISVFSWLALVTSPIWRRR